MPGFFELLIIFVMAALVVWPACRICGKAGFPHYSACCPSSPSETLGCFSRSPIGPHLTPTLLQANTDGTHFPETGFHLLQSCV